MDSTALLNRLYTLRDTILFFWHNPAALKEVLLNNHQLLIELGAILIIVMILLGTLLIKPQKRKTILKTNPAPQKKVLSTSEKTFGSIPTEQKKKVPLAPPVNPPARSAVKKPESAPIFELSEEEERALQEAMAVAGKQALAEVTGEPHQTEIFQSSQAGDAAKKIFAGQKRSGTSENLPQEEKTGKLSPAEFIMIYYMAPRSHAFEGEEVFALLRDLGLTLNDQHVFECNNEQGLQFYVSSAVKPGHFDIHRLHYRIPGIAFVLDIMSVADPEATFNDMLRCIHQFSQILRGDILDENRQRLTQSNIHQYTARIKAAVANKY